MSRAGGSLRNMPHENTTSQVLAKLHCAHNYAHQASGHITEMVASIARDRTRDLARLDVEMLIFQMTAAMQLAEDAQALIAAQEVSP